MIYLDSSAIVKLFKAEPGSTELRAHLEASEETLVSSVIAETEVRRAATRYALSQDLASRALGAVAFAALEREVCTDAGLLPGPDLRSLDALHIATALRLQVTEFITFDDRQAAAATTCGLTVVTPS